MIENVECPVYPKLAEECKEVLGRFKFGEITDPQFNTELCEISCRYVECIEDFRWKPMPTKTTEYAKWKFLSKEEKESLVKNNPTYVHDKINSYLDSVEHIENRNNRNKVQLIDWLKLEITRQARIKVEEILDTYSGRNNGKPQ